MLLYGIIVTLMCASMALWPDRQVRRVKRRIKEGGDRYFEEQRVYQSYPTLTNPKRLRLMGAIGTICGLIVCAISVYRP